MHPIMLEECKTDAEYELLRSKVKRTALAAG